MYGSISSVAARFAGVRLFAVAAVVLCAPPLLFAAFSSSPMPEVAAQAPDPGLSAQQAATHQYERARGLDSGPAIEYLPPKPGVTIDPAALADHSAAYAAGPRQTQGRAPLAAFDYTRGDHKAIVILAAFSDVAHSSYGQSYYDDKLNYNGTSRTSARTFYLENSLGNFTLYATVTDWVTLPSTQAYYDGSDDHMAHLAGDAAAAANSQVDFTQFDEDGDGWVDNLVVIHSGGDEAAGCTPNCVWSHMSYGYQRVVDGMSVSPYATVADFGAPSGDPLGAFTHEFGHLAFGLPDLYDTSQNPTNDGVGIWDMMSGGSWYLNHFSAWSKEFLNWVDPFVPTFNVDPYTIYPATDARYNPVKITTNYTNEYFLIEMRADTGGRYDGGVPVNGLVIYHVDSNIADRALNGGNIVEVNTAHKGVDVEEVGTQDLDVYGGTGYSNDVWVTNSVGFTPTSTPNSNLYVNSGSYATGIRAWNISGVISSGGSHQTFSIDTGRVNYGLTGQVIGSAEQSVLPGSAAVYQLQFTTSSSVGDNVGLSLDGANQTLGSIDVNQRALGPLGSVFVNLTVTIPPDWSAGDPAWVQVRATSTTDSRITFLVPTITRAAQTFSVEALGAGALGFWAVPDVTYLKDFTVHNLGNGADNISVSVTADPALLSASVVTQPVFVVRGGSTSVPLEFVVAHTVPYGTDIPVSFDVRFGPLGALQHIQFSATVHADHLSIVGIEVQAGGAQLLNPGQPRTYNITIHNLGNWDAPFVLETSSPEGVTASFLFGMLSVPAFANGTMGATVEAALDAPAGSTGLVWFTVKYQNFTLVTAAANMSYQVTHRFALALTGAASFSGQPGAHASFNLVAVNNGNGPDRVTVSFTPLFLEWQAALSLTSIALDTTISGGQVSFQFTATVPMDAVGNLQQTFVVTIRSNESGITATAEVAVLVLPVYAFDATADAAQSDISGSESASYVLTFHNRGNVRDSYSVTVDGLPEGWTTGFDQSGIATVLPKGSAQSTLLVKPAPGAAADTYDFQIFISSEGNLSRPLVIPLNVTVLAHREIQLRATPVSGDVRPGATVSLTVVVKNLGNVRENVFLQTTGTFGSMAVDPLQVSIPPFEERVVTVVITLRPDQAAGVNPLVIDVTDVNHPEVRAETTVDISVAAVTFSPPTTPGLEGAAAVAAILSVAAIGALSRRRRR